MRFVDPKNDIAFKKIFGNNQHTSALIGLLNVCLELAVPIESVHILSPYQMPNIKDLKNTLLDIRAIDENGNEFIVEMQVERDDYFGKRAIYYTAKNYVNQIKVAEEYRSLKPVYFLGILDFALFEGDSVVSRHILINQSEDRHDLRDLDFNFIELKKFTKKQSELVTLLDKWCYFFKNASNCALIPENDNEHLIAAYESASAFAWSQEELDIYDYTCLEAGTRKNELSSSLNEGIQQGIEQGIQQGIQQGIITGILRNVHRQRMSRDEARAEIIELQDEGDISTDLAHKALAEIRSCDS